jgi:16S rRNA (guanine1207-N2)-methyltransferase
VTGAGRSARDAALDALMLPFDDGALAWPADPRRVAFLRARAGVALPAQAAHWQCEQGFRPAADALLASGLQLLPTLQQGAFDCVLALPPRQRQESRALLARALALLAPGGCLVAAQRNDEGARSMHDDLDRLVGGVQAASKHHCRVAWATRPNPAAGAGEKFAPADRHPDAALATAWLADDQPRALGSDGLLRRPGLFAWDRLDAGSALLIDALPADLHGRAADLGAGVGALSVALLRRCPAITTLDLFEAEARALELARANVQASSPDIPVGYHWHDVSRGLPDRFDTIVMNPPFHTGRAAEPALGLAFIAAASDALAPGGRLVLVANRQLPYETALAAGFASVRRLRDADGFKVVEARKATA